MFTMFIMSILAISIATVGVLVAKNKIDRDFGVILLGGLLVFEGLLFFTCLKRVDPGEIGIVVNMLGGEKGVEDQEKTVGIHFVAPWKNMYFFPTFEQNHQWVDKEGFAFQTSEGLSLHADIGITYHLEPTRIHNLFARYRRGMDEITHLFIRNNIRDYINRYASKMKIEDLMGEGKEEFFKNVHNSVQAELSEMGFIVTHIYTIGQFHVPETVKNALNAKIVATQEAQQRENELRETEAQAKKIVAQARGEAESKVMQAKAIAEANLIVATSLTPELIKWSALQKWNGVLPTVMGGKDMPFIINLQKEGK